jgi:hypothetical protein
MARIAKPGQGRPILQVLECRARAAAIQRAAPRLSPSWLTFRWLSQIG